MSPGPFDMPITEPGVYDIPDEAYHRDPVPDGSLSSTGVRKLLSPSCPAKFDYQRRHGQAYTRVFDFGHAAHRIVLGAGSDIALVNADNYRTKAARQAQEEARAAGQTPLLPHEHAQVVAMAEALRAHPFAAALFAPGTGEPEKTLVWVDPSTGVTCRAKLDWLRRLTPGRLLVPDYKSAASAEPERLRRAVYEHGYQVQAAFYLRGVRALGLHPDPAFLFVAQEKEPPYLVTVLQLDAAALADGDARCQQALKTYAECARSGHWPGYADEVVEVSLPPWATREEF